MDMTKILRGLGALFAALFNAIGLSGCQPSEPPAPPVALPLPSPDEHGVYRLTSDALYRSFKTDSKATERLLGGKTLVVTGWVVLKYSDIEVSKERSHPGFRPAHAKGLFCVGTFTPAPEAAALTRAAHAAWPSTPVTVRFSDSTGLPAIPDNDPGKSGPRGLGVRFHLGEHEHTDLVAHSTDGFPVRTGEEFLELQQAAAALLAGNPAVIGAFLASHPNAKRFVEAPKPVPASFLTEAYFAVTAFKFTNAAGAVAFGRFRVRPETGTQHLTDAEAAVRSPDFLFDEFGPRLASGPARLRVVVQVAGAGDDVADASTPWPADRPEVPFGTLTLTARADDQAPDLKRIIFDPVPRVDGLDPAGDPLTQIRSDAYLLSGRKRRAEDGA